MRPTLGALAVFFGMISFSCLAQTKVDPSLEPPATEQDRLSEVVKDLYVVTNKYMKKKDRWVISAYTAIDFSDGPFSIYGYHLNPGYVFNDFWELHLNFAPIFTHRERPIVDKIRGLQLASGDKASITMEKAQVEVGFDVVWAPLYGKDSFGMNSILHSDSFYKFGVSYIKYAGDFGWKIHNAVGKTFFLSQNWAIRPAAVLNLSETIVDKRKSFQFIGNLELGGVYYF